MYLAKSEASAAAAERQTVVRSHRAAHKCHARAAAAAAAVSTSNRAVAVIVAAAAAASVTRCALPPVTCRQAVCSTPEIVFVRRARASSSTAPQQLGVVLYVLIHRAQP